MTAKRLPNGTRHTLATIAERCIEVGDCLLWQGATTGGGKPAINNGGRSVSLRAYIFTDLLGKKVPRGKLVSYTCTNPLCVEGEHLKAMTRKEMTKRSIERTGYPERADWLAKCARAGQRSSGIDPDLIEVARNAEGSNRKVARETGLSRHVVDGVRGGRTWVKATPFTGLGARQAANDSNERKRA